MSYLFDGSAKQITLPTGMTVLNLLDLYSRWKDWVYSGNAEYSTAFITVGGDIPAIPLYLFLSNGWRIVPQSSDHTLTVINGILNNEEGGDPFVDPLGSYKIRINREAPGIAIGYSSSNSDIPQTTINAVADKVWQKVIENYTAEEMMRVFMAALSGKREGLGTATEKYMAVDGVTPRITLTADANGNGTPVINGAP